MSFFNIKYEQGFDWYREVFSNHDGEPIVGDNSPGYMKSRQTPRRIAARLPLARVVFCLRNPVDRAFSQWWHTNRTGWTNIDFEDVFYNHHAWDLLVEPGFYDAHLERWVEQFDKDQLLVVLFDDFVADNEAFIERIYEFVGADPGFRPSIVGEKQNTGADMQGPPAYETAKRWFRHTMPSGVTEAVKPVYDDIKGVIESESEYARGMNENVRKQLELVYSEDVAHLGDRIDRDLSGWFEFVEPGSRDDVDFDPTYRTGARQWNTTENVQKNYRRRRT